MREVGAFLAENSPKANATVYERFRAVLNEGSISHRVQYMIEVLMQVRKDKYKDNPILPEGLDLVEEDEQITHQIQLEEELQVQEGLSTFSHLYFKLLTGELISLQTYSSLIRTTWRTRRSTSQSKQKYWAKTRTKSQAQKKTRATKMKTKVLSSELFFCYIPLTPARTVEAKEGIEDRTETNLVNLRRTIYLTIMNALNYEEAVHKLLKIQLSEGEEVIPALFILFNSLTILLD